MKRTTKIWMFFWILDALGSLVAGIATQVFFNGYGLLSGATLFSLIGISTVCLAWTQVPTNYEWTVEVLGKSESDSAWRSGLHFLFPIGKFMQVSSHVYMGTQMMEVFDDKKEEVDFDNGSAPIKAFVYFRIVDSYKAVYAIADVFRAIGEQVESAIRSYLANLDIDQANQLKSQLDLAAIFGGVTPDEEGKLNFAKTKDEIISENEVRNKIRDQWGVEIEKIVISDITLSEEIMKLRTRIMEAEKKLEAATTEAEAKIAEAEGDKKAKIKRAEGERKALCLVGEGLANQVKTISQTGGIKPHESIRFLGDLKKWGSVEGKENALIIDGTGSGIAGIGAHFGAGQRTFERPWKNRDNRGEQRREGGKDAAKSA